MIRTDSLDWITLERNLDGTVLAIPGVSEAEMAPIVLLAERDSTRHQTLIRSLESDGAQVHLAASVKQMLEVLAGCAPDALLLDLSLCTLEAEVVVAMIHMVSPETRVVVYSERSSPKDADALQGGVFYYASGGDESYVHEAIRAALLKKRTSA